MSSGPACCPICRPSTGTPWHNEHGRRPGPAKPATQNTHGSVPHEEDLAALLRAVLAAPLNEADREQAARTVVQVADDLAVPGPDAARNRLATLRTALTGAAGIAQPALDIISRILPLLGS